MITDTWFPHKAIHKGTWRHPGTGKWHTLDHILLPTQMRKRIKDVRVYRGADIDSDHLMVVGKLYMEHKMWFKHKVKKCMAPRISIDLDDSKLTKEYQKQIQHRLPKVLERKDNIETVYQQFQATAVDTAKEIFKPKVQKRKEWVPDSLLRLVENKRKTFVTQL